jgi:hypothetical protein
MASGSDSSDVTGLWLSRFAAPGALHLGNRFHLYTTRRVATNNPVVVVTGAPAADLNEARSALDEVARVHGLLDSPYIPTVEERAAAGEIEFVSLNADVLATIEGLRAVSGPEDGRLPYEAGFAFTDALLRALVVAHGTIDPLKGGPICLGALSTHNVLVTRQGGLLLIGFGHHLLGTQGSTGRPTHAFCTPEVWAGAVATPGEDIYAVVRLSMSLLPFIALPPALEGYHAWQAFPKTTPLAELVSEQLRGTIYALPWQRMSSAADFLAGHERVLDMLGSA